MVRKRPCRICRRWFRPHPRAGDRQRTCSDTSCQAERRRRCVAAWRARHPGYDREDRLRRRLHVDPADVRGAADPWGRIPWSAARNAVGMEVAVVIEESGRVLGRWVRNAVARQDRERSGEFGGVPTVPARNAIGAERASP